MLEKYLKKIQEAELELIDDTDDDELAIDLPKEKHDDDLDILVSSTLRKLKEISSKHSESIKVIINDFCHMIEFADKNQYYKKRLDKVNGKN